ncbi:hypothetical protein CJ197_04085 [Brachybacterium sp. UMB0905]|nr:hypothetical protein CJ197_04085 [Brachybacterium sp. UMB0905]
MLRPEYLESESRTGRGQKQLWDATDVNVAPLLMLLIAALAGCAGVVLALVLAWMRRRGASQWWVAKPLVDSEFANAPERIVLLILPLAAQTLIVGALAVLAAALAALLGAPTALINGLLLGALALEVVVWLVIAIPTAHSSVLPLWMYPAWLRGQRAADRERFQREARARRARR